MVGTRRQPGDGTPFLAGLLLLALGAVGAVTWQAVEAARSHRAVAEGVLRDYAALAGAELVRRSVASVGYGGYYTLLTALRDGPPGPLPTPAELARRDGGRLSRATALARFFFRFRPGATLEVSGAAPPPAVEEWLVAALAAQRSQGGARPALVAFNGGLADGAHRVVVLPFGTAEDPSYLGLEVDVPALAPWLAEALDRGPLLPPTLAAGAVDNSLLAVRVVDGEGPALFTRGDLSLFAAGGGEAPRLAAVVPFGDAYEGIFEGVEVEVAIDPRAAPQLVIGGLPRSRLPLLAALLALTAGLLLAALAQLRRARALARLRSDFVSRVSHELRTPLTQIRMFTETLLLGRVRSPAESRRALEIVDQEARRLGQLVDNALELTRAERGAIELSPRRHDAAALVEETVRSFAPLAGGCRLVFTRREAAPIVAAVDADALRQVVLNLLDNAVKYGPAGQQVRVEVAGADGRLTISVEDEGPGVPRSERRRVWRRFERLERDRRRAIAGTGIGLAVVRELVAGHGGGCRVEEGAAGGARFVVELPAAGEVEG